jgi:hypothetical protein
MQRYLRATELCELEELSEPAKADSRAYDGVAFGAEFCHRRLPTLAEVAEARERCRGLGVEFALVLPLTREAVFDEVWGWLAEAILPGEEWISNDLGLLYRAAAEGLENPATAGRLLSRQRRGPRVRAMIGEGPDDSITAYALRGSMWDDPASAAMIERLKVTRVELDALLQGINKPALPENIPLTICGPWIPVTLTPDCHWTPEGVTQLDCPGSCRGRAVVRMENDEDATPLWSRGNAVFAKVKEGDVVEQARSTSADRVVWSVGVPG